VRIDDESWTGSLTMSIVIRLLTAKLTEYSTIESAAQVILSITRESKMHVSFCETWGISETELQNTPESPATGAYGGYLLNIGIQGRQRNGSANDYLLTLSLV
jgi:thiaminase